ncbi:DNA-directed RNA polymerase 1 subunit [Grosmannia clavigera kw1407]|uniref:DNA-directed RNA polymerase subunit n=1 Tax=Grosmannia clavigera (strain kw1407 / UAMH 11150) TaxID=655863 RepID=F0X7X1_GROCL|nr:DNA-directed RNA polymerase 1 subunit [Grosmannia clavigera kw1407]EFX06682.1 DNA-directed RNA polymerase 1 subunit [Grosmannia clavigera kw1407]
MLIMNSSSSGNRNNSGRNNTSRTNIHSKSANNSANNSRRTSLVLSEAQYGRGAVLPLSIPKSVASTRYDIPSPRRFSPLPSTPLSSSTTAHGCAGVQESSQVAALDQDGTGVTGNPVPLRPTTTDDGISGKPFVRPIVADRPCSLPLGSLLRGNGSPTEEPLASSTPTNDSPGEAERARTAEREKELVTASRMLEDLKASAAVPVGVSRLHVVDLPTLQMRPIYWSPVHDIAVVQRATWFYRDTMLPLEPAVANQLESLYRELRPWTDTWADELRCALDVGAVGEEKVSQPVWPKPVVRDSKTRGRVEPQEPLVSNDRFCASRCLQGAAAVEGSLERQTVLEEEDAVPDVSEGTAQMEARDAAAAAAARSFASYHIVFKDGRTAFLLKSSLKPSAYYGRRPVAKICKGATVGIPIVRGFDRDAWSRVHEKASKATATAAAAAAMRAAMREVAGATDVESEAGQNGPEAGHGLIDCPGCRAEKMSSQVTDLVLVAHGVGQKLAERVESFHFTHAINGLRRAVNAELRNPAIQAVLRPDHNGIMLLPVNWRHTVSFEDGGLRPGQEAESGGAVFGLKDIEPDTIPAVRSVISDVMFDIPFYMSHHKPTMIRALVQEANRVYRLWCRNNPGFAEHGRVHLIGHSLGSAMAIEVLSRQPTVPPPLDPATVLPQTTFFEFDTKNLFLLGSPAAFFLLLERGSLVPRRGRHKPGFDASSGLADGLDSLDDLDGRVVGEASFGCLAVDNIYNILAKEDPIAYLLNGTIDTTYAAGLRPAYVPSATAGLLASVGHALRGVMPGMATTPHPAETSLLSLAAAATTAPTMVRLPSQLELEVHDFTREEIAERKAYLLNDNGQIDYFLHSGGGPLEMQYLNMLSAHTSYWTNPDLVRMLCVEIGRRPGRQHTLPAMRVVKATKRIILAARSTMNVSQPVASTVESVEFVFLSASEIRAASVRRIENESTFDTLLNPVPGGLYDPALGAWGDAICTTCNLGQSLCPGHAGHIDLPVPVYHPVFLDQTLRLLRAECMYCHHFRLPHKELNQYVCKLRLLQYGLLAEATNIDAIGEDYDSLALPDVPQIEIEADDDSMTLSDSVSRARSTYVRQVLQNHKISAGDIRKGKHEGASEMRRDLVAQFMKDIVTSRQCSRCKGISPSYRRDRFVKVFEKPLSSKEQAKMAVSGHFKVRDALTIRRKPGHNESDAASDEGIADIDLDSASSDSETVEKDVDELDESGKLVQREAANGSLAPDAAKQRYISAQEVLERLRLLFHNEQEVLQLIYSSRPQAKGTQTSPDMFFIEALLVPPNKYRPEARTGDSEVTESQQNSLYKGVLGASFKVADIHREILTAGTDRRRQTGLAARDIIALHEAWTELQSTVNSLIDSSKNPVQGQNAKRIEEGIKQKLEKKEGLFRKNMMGKRVNFAARSVISPDPNIETNEIGVPPVFARKLTYPEPVTSHNFKVLQQAVINGTDKWPGASAIENENGQVVNLRSKSLEERMALANQLLAPTSNSSSSGMRGKKVYRHLSNGDVVLMNRQPTLHKPSIMGHRVRVLPGEKTIRMHYANCNTYNADFDGDEMNMHFPQNEIARVEALQLADTDHQYLSGTQGKPLRGLIQDHLSISVALCSKDTFFPRGAYQELIYSALRPGSGHIMGERIELVPPAILKPVPRWTGKQVITTILKNIKPVTHGDLWMSGKCQVPGGRWGTHTEEGTAIFQDGVLVTGILDKAHLGPSSGGFIHAIHEVYGAAVAGKLLSSMGRLLTKLLNMRAFTCGMDDLRLTTEGEANRRRELKAAEGAGLEVAAAYVSLQEQKPTSKDPELLHRLEEVMRDDSKQEGLDVLMNNKSSSVSSGVTKACLPDGLEKAFPHNHMQSMTTSGAKGGGVNANLISCNLGQQVLEGRRVPLMVSGKSLPCFPEYDSSLRAGGYIVNRFLTGIRPQEYYFHHMAGREGLIDTAVKTSRSGYLQRCLIKGMEGLKVAYDTSVRDADGSVVQFLYGEDGLDVTKQKYLTDFSFLLRNLDSQMSYMKFSDPRTAALFEHREEFAKQTKRMIKKAGSSPTFAEEPVNSLVNPARHAYAMSEKFFSAMSTYIRENKDRLVKDKKEQQTGGPAAMGRKSVERVFAAKYLRSQVEPGESVGIVAGQSVGEPSTQMTLNTFHLAGHSAKNVTLGIPRLREILMTASAKISTPAMTLVLKEGLAHEQAEQFAKSISLLPLSHVLDEITVRERVGKGVGYAVAKMFDVRLRLFPSAEYTTTYAVEVAQVLDAVEKRLMPTLRKLMAKALKQHEKSSNSGALPEIGVRAGVVAVAAAAPSADEGDVAGEDDDSDGDEGDNDATSAKQRANRDEAVSYGPNDDDDDAIQAQMDRTDDELSDDEGNVSSSKLAAGSRKNGDEKEDKDENDEDENEDEDDDDDRMTGVQLAEHLAKSKEREARVKGANQNITRFRADEKLGEWCEFTLELAADAPKMLMLSVVEDAVRRSVVRQISGVGACTFVENEEMVDPLSGEMVKKPVVHTVGTNVRAMQSFSDVIDTDQISTNDIVSVLEIYGVEACRNTIIRELNAVFGSHGISVDHRHLNLIGDYMTRGGGFMPFNRYGLKGNVSPFTKMSFETTLAFLKDALIDADWDGLTTPSSRIVMGRLSKTGTGSFDVLTRVPMEHYDPMQGVEAA